MLIASLALVPVIVGYNPTIHKPFVFEGEDFKLTKSYEEPKSLQTIKLFRLGEAPAEDKKTLVQDTEIQKPQHKNVHIEPSEFYQYASGVYNNSEIASLQGKNLSPEEEDINQADDEDLSRQESEEVSVSPIKNKILQRKEETIAWNKWRSDLQNKIMMDASVDAPLGTLMMFSFKVNKDRQVSDIKVLSTNPFYQNEAAKKIGAAITRCNGDKILEFPKNTRRKSVKFDGSYLIWFETEFSTPANFNDMERFHYYE